MTTYSINLDDVDLALLPLGASYNNFLKKEYYQFEVMKTATYGVPEPSPLYTCHVCAIDMPAAFAHEHITSIKHRANARIASVAAQRSFALINNLPPPSTAQLTTRFCANCSTVADDDHYKTAEHRVAVRHDNLLWDLMKAYVQEDVSKYDHEIANNQINLSNETNENNNYKKDDLEYKNDENNKNNNATVTQPKDKNQLTESIDGKKEHKPILEKNIAKNYEMFNGDLEFTDDNNDNISMSSNLTEANNTVALVKNGILIEYPYKVTAKGHIRCVVCNCQVPGGIRNREEHINGSRHRTMVLAQNQPTGRIEEEDNISKSKDSSVTIKFSDINVGSQISYPYELTATGRVWCTVCNCKLTGKRNSEEHSRGSKHRHKVFSQSRPTQPIEDRMEHNNEISDNTDNQEKYSEDEELCDDNNRISQYTTAANNGNTIGDSQIKYPYKETATDHIWCVVCECQLPNSEQNRQGHIKGRRHRNMAFHKHQENEAIEEKEEENDLIVQNYDIYHNLHKYSEEKEFSDGSNDNNSINNNIVYQPGASIAEEEEKQRAENSEIDHSLEENSEYELFTDDNTDNHSMRVGDMTVGSRIEYPFKVMTTEIECVACKCKVGNNKRSIKQHIKGKKHRGNAKLQGNKVDSQIVYQTEHVECVVCKCKVPDNKHDRKTHIKGKRHRKKSKLSDNNRMSVVNSANSQIEYPFEVTAIGHVECIVCECKVSSNVRTRRKHIEGWRHRNMVLV